MTTNLRRSGVALFTAFAYLVLMTGPASATANHSVSVTGGTVDIHRTSSVAETFPAAAVAGCPTATSSVSHTGANPDVINITAFFSQSTLTLSNTGAAVWVAVMTRTNSANGTLTSTTLAGVGLTLQIDIFNLAATTPCSPTGTRVCRFTAVLSFSGTTSGPISQSETANSTSTSPVLASAPPCTSTFTALNGGTVKITNLPLHIATV